ncbi:MAG: HAMP domain-containing sensor histidine kinase [Mariniblastus sp.]|nr:HAMP domain-containing sensor histidine kinase [Mariniblastus sp.]
MMLIIVMVLSAAGLQGVLQYRQLTKSMRERSMELPEAAKLSQKISELRSLVSKRRAEVWERAQNRNDLNSSILPHREARRADSQLNLQDSLRTVEQALDSYEIQLTNSETKDPRLREKAAELEFIVKFRVHLETIGHLIYSHDDFTAIPTPLFDPLEDELSELQSLVAAIPVFMQQRMETFSERARTEYHTWMMFSVILGFVSIGVIAFLMIRFRQRIIHPLETLLEGSRQVAGGNYDYRIDMNSEDEVAELGDALNAMTANFQEIKSDLNRQVQQRTKEVVRSEKMASVGFLAAGVAHEINNPLATIAWSAESLESRIQTILDPPEGTDQVTVDSEIADMKKYLRRIQDEAFRCKGITAGLLDFSRLGDAIKVRSNLAELIDSVIAMLKPLSKYRGRNIVFNANSSIVTVINEQEMKQVALNLITNALGSVGEQGTVEIELQEVGKSAVLRVTDDGCGMDEEVKKHLFEPFFTRRRDGQGTGLGLSITYQIIEEHGGRITADSEGPGHGSTFTVSLPLVENEERQLAKSA